MILRAFPRIHLGLFNTGDPRLPAFGGMGFSITGPETRVSLVESDVFELDACNHFPPGDDAGMRSALGRLDDAEGGLPAVKVTLEAHPPRHAGFGTGTCAVLAVLDSISRRAGSRRDREFLQKLSQRGGASGIGLHAYFDGGFIVDGGHRAGSRDYLPSSSAVPEGIPPLILRLDMPRTWRVALLLPEGRRLYSSNEAEFFHATLPTPREEVHAAIAIAYQLVARSVQQADLNGFRSGVDLFNSVGFKREEIAGQDPAVDRLLNEIRAETDYVATMSSLGPLVVAIGEATENLYDPSGFSDALSGPVRGSKAPESRR